MAGKLKKPKGVEVVSGKYIRISFTYAGKRYYETLYNEVTEKNLERAGVKRAAIMMEIESNSFDYRRHFPDSKHALKFAGLGETRPTVTVGEMLDKEADILADSKAPSTVKAEKSRHKHIRKYFGDARQVKSLTVEDIEAFKRSMRKEFSAKTVNNTLIPLRAILKRAYRNGVLERPVHDRFENYPADETKPTTDINPFTMEELSKFEAVKTQREGDRDMYLFAAWSGLSNSEIRGLAWSDVDTSGDVWTVHVQRAYVDRSFKVPKEKSRNRVIELNSKAQGYLEAQRSRTMLMPAIKIKVLQRDNLTWIKESIKPVFRNYVSNGLWKPDSYNNAFHMFCRRADIELRGPNQMRHTFASRMLTLGMDIQMLARLMGHRSPEMVIRHYSKFIHDDMKGNDALVMDALISKQVR